MKLFPEQNTLHRGKMRTTIFDIQRCSFVDGPGIRTTVFFKGCNLKCKWCHNPESQSFGKQIISYQSKCTDCGKCRDLTAEDENFICFNNAKKICGQEYSVENILKEVLKDKSFYETSGGGVTFSGGECMLHIDFLKDILQKCKENDIHTAVDTAGNVPWHYFEKIMSCTDLFLYDVKCFSEQLHKTGTGITNELILENLKKLSDKFKGDIIIRIPVVTGFNDDIEEIIKISEFLKDIHYSYIEILPYHKMGEHKYEALGIKCFEYAIPEKENIEKYKKILNI